MDKLLRKDRIKFYLSLIVLSIVCSFLMLKKAKGVDMISTLTSANYIPMFLNNLYIYYIYTRCKKIKGIYDKIVCRIGSKKFFYLYIFNIIIDILLYILIVDLSLYLRVGIDTSYIQFYILFQILRFVCFFIEELISMVIFLRKNSGFLIIIPIILNIAFHYFLSPFLVDFYFGRL